MLVATEEAKQFCRAQVDGDMSMAVAPSRR
jgi:hypothetical protein